MAFSTKKHKFNVYVSRLPFINVTVKVGAMGKRSTFIYITCPLCKLRTAILCTYTCTYICDRHVYKYVHMCTFVFICVLVGLHMCSYVYNMCLYVYICVHMRTYVYICAHVRTQVYICFPCVHILVHMYICVYQYIPVHINVHLCTHVHMFHMCTYV